MSQHASAQGKPVCGTEYVVVAGDTLSIISRQLYGRNKFLRLHEINLDRIGPDANRIEIGTLLRLPCDIDAAPTASLDDFSPTADLPQDADALPVVSVEFNKAFAPGLLLNTEIIDPFLRDIERATEGRVTFTAPATPNTDTKAQFDLIADGPLEAGYVFNGDLAARNPLVQITMYPLIGGSALETSLALWRVQTTHFAKADLFEGVKLLGFVGAPPAQLWKVDEATAPSGQLAEPYVSAISDLPAGGPPSDLLRSAFEAPGGRPFGTAALSHSAARATGIWRDFSVAADMDGGLYVPTFSVLISQEKWEQISPQDQAAIERLAGEALAVRSAVWDKADESALVQMRAAGLRLVDKDPGLVAELHAHARLNWETWIREANELGISGFDAINEFLDEIKALKKQFRS